VPLAGTSTAMPWRNAHGCASAKAAMCITPKQADREAQDHIIICLIFLNPKSKERGSLYL